MLFLLVLGVTSPGPTTPGAADPPAPAQYFVVDFAPLGKLPECEVRHWLYFKAERPERKPGNWVVGFKSSTTTAQVRNDVFSSLEKSDCKVKKVGDTKILFYGCKTLTVKTEQPGRTEFAAEARPTVKEYATEKEALEAK